jgi:hypothetical protein
MPSQDPLLGDLLAAWRERYDRGEDVPPEALCDGRVDLVDELRRRIAALKANIAARAETVDFTPRS